MTEQDLADLLREELRRHRVPGAAIGIVRGGVEMIAWDGVASTRTGEPLTAHSRFGVGSLTKAMVATVVARLDDDGRLPFDDRVADRVPELESAAWAKRASVRELLANRSGLPLREALEFDFDPQEDDDAVLADLAARVAVQEPTAVDWSYSNVGWALVGRAIEVATERVWEDAMHETLFAPAGMHHTAFASDRRVSGHDETAEGNVPVAPLYARKLGPAGATAVSTVGDMLRFASLHLRDDRLARLREEQRSPRIYGWLDGWCLGWASFDWEGSRAWGWDGLLTGERAMLRLLPERDTAVVLLTNGSAGRALGRALLPQVLDVSVPPLQLDFEPGAGGDLSRFEGAYAWPDRRVLVTAGDDSLVLEVGGRRSEGLPLDEATFLVDPDDPDDPTVTFADFDAAGRPQVLYSMLWGLPRVSEE